MRLSHHRRPFDGGGAEPENEPDERHLSLCCSLEYNSKRDGMENLFVWVVLLHVFTLRNLVCDGTSLSTDEAEFFASNENLDVSSLTDPPEGDGGSSGDPESTTARFKESFPTFLPTSVSTETTQGKTSGTDDTELSKTAESFDGSISIDSSGGDRSSLGASEITTAQSTENSPTFSSPSIPTETTQGNTSGTANTDFSNTTESSDRSTSINPSGGDRSSTGNSEVTTEQFTGDSEVTTEQFTGDSEVTTEQFTGDSEITTEQFTGNSSTSLPTSVSTETTQDEGQGEILDLTANFLNSTTFSVSWKGTASGPYDLLIAPRKEATTIYNESGIMSSELTLHTTVVQFESFEEYSVTVSDTTTGAKSSVEFWSPPKPPAVPSLNLTAVPEKLLVTWETPANSTRAFLEYWLCTCVNYDQRCEEVNLGADALGWNLTTPTIETYTIKLRASHKYAFADFVVGSESREATTKSCKTNSSMDIMTSYNSVKHSVEFRFSEESFSDICGFGAVVDLDIGWIKPQNSLTCESPLQHTNWEPSSECDPFGCEEEDPGKYRCFIAIDGNYLDGFRDRQIVIKATDKKGRCAFANSTTVLLVSAPGGASVLPWAILAILVTMTTLGVLYKKREPLWTFATDIINTFNKRTRCHNEVELPRVSYFKIRSPGEIARFNDEYHNKKRDMSYAMSLEYEQIQHDSERSMADRSFGQLPELRLKNRYKNIIPFNHNRVTLQPQNGEVLSTYINASLVKGFDGKAKCIVCQGPKTESLEDFLRMLIEYDVSLIASLLSTVNIDTDRDERQCSQYWPREVGASEEFGKYSVKLESESQYDCFLRRNLKISGPSTSHRVTQLHFFRWPDHGTPSKSEDLLTFLSVFRKLKRGTPVIHCSAGVGRSGTLVALDFLMDLLEAGGRCAIPRVVAHLRTQRVSMIQTEEQYCFLYDCIYSALNGKSDAKFPEYYMTHSI